MSTELTKPTEPTDSLLPFDVFGAPLEGVVLVEASAGTGKTWTICALVLRLLLERKLEIAQVLVVTFTQSATAELRERIRSRLVLALAALDGDAEALEDPFIKPLFHAMAQRGQPPGAADAEHLRAALATFDEAAIHTIHGFCQRALALAPLAAGAPLTQELLLDDTDLREQVAQDFWRRHVAAADLPEGLAALLVARRDSPEKWAAWLKWRAEQPLTRIHWPDGIDSINPDAAEATAAELQNAHAEARAAWPHVRDEVLQIVQTALAADHIHAGWFTAENIVVTRDAWDAALASSDSNAAADLKAMARFGNAKFKAKKNKPAVESDGFFATAQAWLDARKAHDELRELQRLRLLRQLLEVGPPALATAKRASRHVTFADMLNALHAELHGPRGAALARALQQRYPVALIDEFQDTDPLQWGIFERLHKAGTAPMVLVGDPKQSIYAFRQADLHTYLRAGEQADQQATLIENQRAVPLLVHALNALFGQRADAFRQPGLLYHPVRSGTKPRPVLIDRSEPRAALQFWALPRANDGGPPTKTAARAAAAAGIAAEIARLAAAAARGLVTLDSRPVKPNDIAVLVRSHNHGAQMRQALQRVGMASVELSQASVFDGADAQALDELLAAVLSPHRESLARTALAGVAMGWTATELHAAGPDDQRLAQALQRMAGYRTLWSQRGVAVMLHRWMAAEGVAPRLLAGPDGERRLTNLLHLIELLQSAAAEHPNAEALHRWLRQQRREKTADDAAQQRLESDGDRVHIVTVHKSKGLEYPFVFCPLLWDGFAGSGDRRLEGRQLHDDDGLAVRDLRNPETLGKTENEALKAREREARQAEQMRLVYVALTRAVQRCDLVVGDYVRRLGDKSTNEAQDGPLAWLMPAGAQAFCTLLAAAHPGAVALAPLPGADAFSADVATGLLRPMRELQALPAPAHLPTAWSLASYSRLVHSARSEGAARDHDTAVDEPRVSALGEAADAVDAAAAAAAVEIAAEDILRFPRGAAAGECLHAVFENAGFDDPSTWPAAVQTALASHPPPATLTPPETLAAQALSMLDSVLGAGLPLSDGRELRLSHIPPTQRLTELEFMLPGQVLRAESLAALLRRFAHAVPPLAFHTLQGPLRGFIDLVFEHEGRFHILDWKSNHLGESAADYAAPALARAMEEHGYGLQRVIYVLALHRHLQRCQPDYDYERHMGDALYLFVRGVRSQWPGAGVVAYRPPLALVQGLSDWLDAR